MVRQELQEIQRSALFARRAGKQVVNFIDDQYARLNGVQQSDGREFERVDPIMGAVGRLDDLKQLGIKAALRGRRRHFHAMIG